MTAPLEPYEEKNVASKMDRCIHFGGLVEFTGPPDYSRRRETCQAGVEYASVRDDSKPLTKGRLPCFRDGGCSIQCSRAEFMTREAAVADWLETKERVRERFARIHRGECPDHKVKVELRQVGQCVYGSCGCRLYHGTLLPKRKARQ